MLKQRVVEKSCIAKYPFKLGGSDWMFKWACNEHVIMIFTDWPPRVAQKSTKRCSRKWNRCLDVVVQSEFQVKLISSYLDKYFLMFLKQRENTEVKLIWNESFWPEIQKYKIDTEINDVWIMNCGKAKRDVSNFFCFILFVQTCVPGVLSYNSNEEM